jgi:hypothetical protein
VAVGIALYHGKQLGVRCGEAREETQVLFESAGANLYPARTHWHGGLQRLVYGMAGATISRRGPLVESSFPLAVDSGTILQHRFQYDAAGWIAGSVA